ncbi:hypothetical protein T492DRAFT_886141 [Pavlovales sp. CCMP2436]|nr:hypothetical protein T492DRAFT_886141 [Pavlovales sp. CCMP2436]
MAGNASFGQRPLPYARAQLGPAAAGITRSGQAFLDAQIAHVQCVVAAAVPVLTLDVERGAKDDNEGKPATALGKVLAVRRVHAHAGMPMVQCRALVYTVKPIDWGTPVWAILKAAVLTMFYQGFRGDDVLVSAARPFTRASLARAGLNEDVGFMPRGESTGDALDAAEALELMVRLAPIVEARAAFTPFFAGDGVRTLTVELFDVGFCAMLALIFSPEEIDPNADLYEVDA